MKLGFRLRKGRLQYVLSSYDAAVWHYGAGATAGTRLRCSVRERCLHRGEVVDIVEDNGGDGAPVERYDGKRGKVLKWT